jgi:hypothetical protein
MNREVEIAARGLGSLAGKRMRHLAIGTSPEVEEPIQRARDAAAEAFGAEGGEWGRIIGSIEKIIGRPLRGDRGRDLLTVLAAVRLSKTLDDAVRVAELIQKARRP